MVKKLIGLTVVAVALIAALSPAALAVEYGGVGGVPAHPVAGNDRTKSIFIYRLKPGQQQSDGVKIYNNTGQQQTIMVGAVDSVLASGGAFSCAQAADAKQGVGGWIRLDEDSITLPAGGNQVVPFNVTVPAKADVGEHDGCITIQEKTAAKPAKNGGVTLSFRSAIRVVVTVPGKIIKKLDLVSLRVSKLKDGNYLAVPTAQNSGNVSLDTAVSLRLSPLVGAEGASSRSTYPVLPHSKASWNIELKRPFWGGWYRARATVTYNSDPTSQLGVDQGPTRSESLASALFFAPPKPLAALIELLVIILIAIGIYLYVRQRRDVNHIRANWVEYTAKANDSLAGLAKARHTTWRKLARVNRLRPPYELKKGQKLRLPPKP